MSNGGEPPSLFSLDINSLFPQRPPLLVPSSFLYLSPSLFRQPILCFLFSSRQPLFRPSLFHSFVRFPFISFYRFPSPLSRPPLRDYHRALFDSGLLSLPRDHPASFFFPSIYPSLGIAACFRRVGSLFCFPLGSPRGVNDRVGRRGAIARGCVECRITSGRGAINARIMFNIAGYLVSPRCTASTVTRILFFQRWFFRRVPIFRGTRRARSTG